jgi:hypothetical protein
MGYSGEKNTIHQRGAAEAGLAEAWSTRYTHLLPSFFAITEKRPDREIGLPPALGERVRVKSPQPTERLPEVR